MVPSSKQGPQLTRDVRLERLPWDKCSKAVTPRSYDTSMRCEECTAFSGKSTFLCNDNKKGVAVHCHEAYHSRYHNKHQ